MLGCIEMQAVCAATPLWFQTAMRQMFQWFAYLHAARPLPLLPAAL